MVTAVASFGSTIDYKCGKKPGGFTRLTPELSHWVKTNAEMTPDPSEFVLKAHLIVFQILRSRIEQCNYQGYISCTGYCMPVVILLLKHACKSIEYPQI